MPDSLETKELDRQAQIFLRVIHSILLEAGMQATLLDDSGKAADPKHSGLTLRRMFVCIMVGARFPYASLQEAEKHARTLLRHTQSVLRRALVPALGPAIVSDIMKLDEGMVPLLTLILPSRQQQRTLYAYRRAQR